MTTPWQRLPDSALAASARDHLWMHFAKHGSYEAGAEVPIITRGEGPWIWDAHGRRLLDGLSGLFTVQIGHGRTEVAEAGARQAATLAYWPLWSYAHPEAVQLAERLAFLAPGDLNRVFFTSGGGEAVETAWKLAKQFFLLTGKPMKRKVISRAVSYHGTTAGALSITGIPAAKTAFEPLVPGAHKAASTNLYRAPVHADDPEAFGRWAADEVERVILTEGADTVAAVFVEPVQNAGGCFPPPPGYFTRLREICDRHDVLLVSDEVICAFGRLGTTFGCDKHGYLPDVITCAKGITSGYAPLGAMIASDRLMEPFLRGDTTFAHGFTFGGHPVSAAVAMANLDVMDREGLQQHVLENEKPLRTTLEKLLDLPIVGDVRGDGYFFGIELVRDQATKQRFAPAEVARLLGLVAPALWDAGLCCRVDSRGDPVVQLAPPLVCDQSHFDDIEQVLRDVLGRVGEML